VFSLLIFPRGNASDVKWGGHIMGIGNSQMRIEGVEVTQGGQYGELGKE
jgi:hypothetical protein